MHSKRPKPRRAGRRQLRVIRSPATELAGLRGAFFAWVDGEQLPIEPAELWEDVVATVDLATARGGLGDLCSWTAEQIAVLADLADDDESASLTALPLLITFLGDTGRWRGTPEDFSAALRAADEFASPISSVLDALAGVEADPEAEDAALRGLPLIAQAEELLRFVGPRRPVTGTGALRRADVVTASGLLGIDLAGRTPRSLWDVPRLADLWETLGNTGLLEVSPSVVTPAPLARAWLSGEDGPSREGRRLVAGGYLLTVLTAPSQAPLLPHPLEALLPVLAMAALSRPMQTVEVLGPQSDPSGRRLVAGFAVLQLRALLNRLTDDGLLDVGETIAAAPGLSAVLAGVMAALLRSEQLADAGAGDVDLPPPDPELAGRAWRLRIELEDARPPVWREVLVDPALPLDELHEIVQAVFPWEEAHLHEFVVTGPRGRTTRMAPPGPDDGWLPAGDPPVDEAGVRLSQVIGPRRGQLRYRYDFGDCWDHRITVVGEEAASPPVPRCTGGSGAAPAEDSGGVYGWGDKVEAARDPRHPEHADVREWLGLEDGETLDPDAFDAAAVEARLRELRP